MAKRKYRFHHLLVQKRRQSHTERIQRKHRKISKIFLDNIKTKVFAEYKYIILGVLSILIIGGGVGIIFFSHFFDVMTIVVERVDIRTNIVPILQFMDKEKGKNILLVNDYEIKHSLHKQFPELKEIEIVKLYPRTLKVYVVEYDLIARIRTRGGKQEMFLNEIGMIRDITAKNDSLPLIEYKNQYDIKDDKMMKILSPFLALQDKNIIMSSEELRTVLNTKSLFEKTFALQVPVIQYYPLEREIHLLTEKHFTVWFDLTGNVDNQIEKLKAALSDFNINAINLAYIDLRIKNKIIYCTQLSSCASFSQQ